MKAKCKIVIVGGVAGGASAAARARRVDESAEITIFERGPYISFANCGLPYHIAGEIEDRSKLLIMTPEKMWSRSHVEVHVNQEALSIDRPAKTIRVRNDDGSEQDFCYDKLILSQGAKPIVPAIPGADLPNVFTLRDVPDMDRILAFLDSQKPGTAAIIGGGFIGLEMAEAFHRRGIRVNHASYYPGSSPMRIKIVAEEGTGRVLSGGCASGKLSCDSISGVGLSSAIGVTYWPFRWKSSLCLPISR